MHSQCSILWTVDPVHDFKKCTCDEVYFSQEKFMYAKAPKTWVHVYPLGSRSMGTGEKQWVIYPGCRGKKIPDITYDIFYRR